MTLLQKFVIFLTIAFTLGLFGQTATDRDDVLVRALKDEMQRSLLELQIDEEPKPYFIAYTVNEGSLNTVQSILGATAGTSQRSSRNLNVALRVGSRELDNTNYSGGTGGPSLVGSFPLTDSYDELRRVIWMRTDEQYKAAVSSLSGKKAALEQQPNLERANDFNVEEPFEYVSDTPVATVGTDKLTAFANEVSAVMQGNPDLQQTLTVVSYITNTRTYIDSDGNFNRQVSSLCSLRSQASAQADDGAMVHDYTTAFASSCEEFFDNIEEIKQRHEELVTSVLEFRSAEHVRAYTGPVLITEEASASFFAQVFATRAGATPTQVSDPGAFDMFARFQNTFMDKIGGRVMPSFISVVNDPTASEFEGKKLFGSYIVDNEGIPARRTELVKDGQLQALLMTRSPVPDLDKSTGSNREGSALPGNLFISSNESVSDEELKEELLTWIEDSGNDFGIVIKRFQDLESVVVASSFDGIRTLSSTLMDGGIVIFPTMRAYKVNLDGSEVPIRTLTPSSFSDSQLRDIVAVSDTRRAYNVSQSFAPATFMSGWLGAALGGFGPGSPSFIGVVAPSFLLEEMEFQGGGTGHPRLPIVSHPASN